MNTNKIEKLLEVLEGINSSEWSRIKQHIDLQFSSRAAKVELDDSTELKRNLQIAFNLRRFGEKLD